MAFIEGAPGTFEALSLDAFSLQVETKFTKSGLAAGTFRSRTDSWSSGPMGWPGPGWAALTPFRKSMNLYT